MSELPRLVLTENGCRGFFRPWEIDRATVTVTELPMVPLWNYPVTAGTRVEVGWRCEEVHEDTWPDRCNVWEPVAVATVEDVTAWETDYDEPWTYKVTLIDIEVL